MLSYIKYKNIKISITKIGALTSKLNQYVFRPWELTSIKFFDLFDSFASPVRIDYKFNKVIRILPILDLNFQNEFITNNSRFNFNILKLNTFTNEVSGTNIYNINNNMKYILLFFNNNIYLSNTNLKNVFNTLISYYKNYISHIKYISFYNNVYIIDNLDYFFSKENFINIEYNLNKSMIRLFIVLFKNYKIYKNINFYLNDDLNFININSIFNIYNKFYNNLNIIYSFIYNELKKNNSFFFFKNLNYISDLLILDIVYKYKYNFDITIDLNKKHFKILLLNIKNINEIINNKYIYSQFNYKNIYQFNFYNILGYNFISKKNLISFFDIKKILKVNMMIFVNYNSF